MLKHCISLSVIGVSRTSKYFRYKRNPYLEIIRSQAICWFISKISNLLVRLTSKLLNPKRVAILPYGTHPLSDSHPRRMSRFKCGSFENTTRSCVSNHGHFSKEISSNSCRCSSILWNSFGDRGIAIWQLSNIKCFSIGGKSEIFIWNNGLIVIFVCIWIKDE